jgi:hypothetical protein
MSLLDGSRAPIRLAKRFQAKPQSGISILTATVYSRIARWMLVSSLEALREIYRLLGTGAVKEQQKSASSAHPLVSGFLTLTATASRIIATLISACIRRRRRPPSRWGLDRYWNSKHWRLPAWNRGVVPRYQRQWQMGRLWRRCLYSVSRQRQARGRLTRGRNLAQR